MKIKYLNKLFYSHRSIRLIWAILAVMILIFAGELIFVDSFVKLLPKLGLS